MIKVQFAGRALILLLMAVLVAACYPAVQQVEEPPQVSSPGHFRARAGEETGIVVDLQGNTNGHLPGEVSVFGLTLSNGTTEIWRGRYCLQLLDGEGVVEAGVQEDFAIEPGSSSIQELPLRFPEDREDDWYGLGLFVERPDGPYAGITYIHMGLKSNTSSSRPVPAGEPSTPEIPGIPDHVLRDAMDSCFSGRAMDG